MDGFTIAHLGDVGETESDRIVRFLTGTDILLIPVGGVYTVNAKDAMYYVDAVKPQIVIPMHFKTKGCVVNVNSVEVFTELAKNKYTVNYFGKEFQPKKYEKTNICVLGKEEAI